MNMHEPLHPGEILKNTYLPEYNLSVTAFALRLGVSRNTASELVNCKIGISANMALRLEKLFNISAKFWIDLQVQYDLWHARQITNFDNIECIAM